MRCVVARENVIQSLTKIARLAEFTQANTLNTFVSILIVCSDNVNPYTSDISEPDIRGSKCYNLHFSHFCETLQCLTYNCAVVERGRFA